MQDFNHLFCFILFWNGQICGMVNDFKTLDVGLSWLGQCLAIHQSSLSLWDNKRHSNTCPHVQRRGQLSQSIEMASSAVFRQQFVSNWTKISFGDALTILNIHHQTFPNVCFDIPSINYFKILGHLRDIQGQGLTNT